MHIKKVTEDVIHKPLESSRSIGQSEWHDLPLKRTITSLECGFPFVAFSYSDKVIGVSEVYGGVNLGFARSGQQVRDEWKWILVLLGDPVKTSEVNTKTEGSVLFPNKEHRGSMLQV